MMILLTLGYVLMALIFLIVRLVYHVLTKSRSLDNLVRAIRGDFISLYEYAKQIVVSNPKKAKIVAVIMVCLIILFMMPLQMEIEYVIEEEFLSTIMFIMFLTSSHRKKIRRTPDFRLTYSDLSIQSSLCFTARAILSLTCFTRTKLSRMTCGYTNTSSR